MPGGHPLAEALASGETPSPELLAAAAESEAMPLWRALVVSLAILSGLGAYAAVAPWVTLARLVPLERPPAVLADRAEQVLASFGFNEPRGDTAEGFLTSIDYVTWIGQTDQSPQRWQRVSAGFPAIYYWYRTSPHDLVPRQLALRATPTDPPATDAGMHSVMLDTRGRLLRFTTAPPLFDPDAAAEPVSPPWPLLFQAAGLDLAAFSPVAPQWNPPDYADARGAWEGPFHDAGLKVRVEASSYRGRPTSFAIVGPWTRPARVQPSALSRVDRIGYALIRLATVALIGGAILLARHNVRARRADVVGATRLATAAIAIELTAWLFGFQHLSDMRAEMGSFSAIAADAVFVGVMLWVAYAAIEPVLPPVLARHAPRVESFADRPHSRCAGGARCADRVGGGCPVAGD